jgi:hypothetical protein
LKSPVGIWNLDLCGELDVSDTELIHDELALTLQTTEQAATELKKRGGAYTEESSSVVYYFYFDLFSRVSQAILNFKRDRDFYSEFDTDASSITHRLCGITLIIVLSAMVVFTIIFSISISDELSKQQVWIYSFLFGLLLDEVVNSSVVIMICDVLIPLCIVMTEVFDAKRILLDCIEKKLSKQSIHQDLGIQPPAVAFNAADYFFVSKQLSSKVLPRSSPVSEVIGIYQSIAPKKSLSLNERMHQWNELRLYSRMQTFSANVCALSLKKLLHLHPLVQNSILHFFVSIIIGVLVIGLVFINTIHSWLIPLLVVVIGMLIGAAFVYLGYADYDRRVQLSQHRALCFHETWNNKMSSASMATQSVRYNIITIREGGDDSQPSRAEADEMIINGHDGGDSMVPLRNNDIPAITLGDHDRPAISLRGISRPSTEINTTDDSITLFERSLLLFEWTSRIQNLSAECSLWPMSPRLNMMSAARKYDIEEGVKEAQRSKKYATDDEKHQSRRDLVGLHTIQEYDVFALSDGGESRPSIYLLSDSDDDSIPLSTVDKAEGYQRSDSISLLDRDSSIVLKQSGVSNEVKDPEMDFDSYFGDNIDLSSSDDDDDDDRSIPLSSSSDDDDSIELSSLDSADSIFLSTIDDDNDDEGDNRSIELSSSSSDDSYT